MLQDKHITKRKAVATLISAVRIKTPKTTGPTIKQGDIIAAKAVITEPRYFFIPFSYYIVNFSRNGVNISGRKSCMLIV